MSEDEKYMERCLQLARLGAGNTRPNPLVGSVIVHRGKIIGEGYHTKAGEAHAEINALAAVKDSSLLGESCLYVNLEPCSHHGKTPPCSDSIVKAGLKRVVIGTSDSNLLVTGKGIARLKQAGIEVECGILENECRHLNRRFFTFHEKKRPYVILKWAQSTDGFIDRYRNSPESRPASITHKAWNTVVHRWRTLEESILVGTRTAQLDNPMLNARHWNGPQPLRLVIDKNLSLPSTLHAFDHSQPTWVFTARSAQRDGSLEFVQLPFQKLPDEILDVLYLRGIQSLIVEGGAQLLQSFIDANRWDEARVFTGSQPLYAGVHAPVLQGQLLRETSFSGQRLQFFSPKVS